MQQHFTARFPQFIRLLAVLLALIVLAGAALACFPPTNNSTGVNVEDVWARPAKTMGGETAMETPATDMQDSSMGHGMGGVNSAIYMRLTNRGQEADRLVSAQAGVAKTIELHETIMEGDLMRMQQVQGGIEVPAGGTVELKPGGLHVMLIGLTQDLNVGDKFPVTLQFDKGGAVTVEAEVRQP
jgi:hypothetical protein